jgi:hypothetical protein
VTQTASSTAPSIPAAAVPQLIEFSGTLLDRENRAMTGPVGVTFALYAEHTGGAALWMETQNVHPGTVGNYTVLLGAASKDGVPEELFAKGEARWLGIQVEQQVEQPRILLVSVPYALKAGDAQTLGGLPPSAFAPANSSVPTNFTSSSSTAPLTLVPPSFSTAAAPLATVGGSGTMNFIPLWTNGTTLGNSILFQSTTSNVNVNGSLSLPALKTATSLAGSNSQPLDLLSSVFSSSTHAAVSQHFRWQAEPVGNNTTSPAGKLNLLFASGTGSPAETGLSINNKGMITAGALLGPLGMLISHVSFGGIAGTSGTAGCNCTGSATIALAREGEITLRTAFTNSSTAFVGAGGSSLGLNRPSTFLSARADWVSPGGIKAGHVFTVVAGNGLGGRFGFKAVGTTLFGMTTAPFSGPETDVNLATTLTAFTSVDLLAVRRASSVEFYVNGVLKGSSTTNLPTGVDDMTGDLYELSVTNGVSNSTDAQVAVNMLTVGIPMF